MNLKDRVSDVFDESARVELFNSHFQYRDIRVEVVSFLSSTLIKNYCPYFSVTGSQGMNLRLYSYFVDVL